MLHTSDGPLVQLRDRSFQHDFCFNRHVPSGCRRYGGALGLAIEGLASFARRAFRFPPVGSESTLRFDGIRAAFADGTLLRVRSGLRITTCLSAHADSRLRCE